MKITFGKIVQKIKTWQFAHATPSKRGEMLHSNYVGGGIRVGIGCQIYSKYPIFGSEPYLIDIGNNVRITDGVKFCTHDGGMWVLRNNNKLKDADYFGRICIEDNVHIGWNAIIMPGVTVGHDSIIGCGAIVTRDIPPCSVAVGVPARVIETIDEYFEKYKNLVDYTKSYTEYEKRQYLYRKYDINP